MSNAPSNKRDGSATAPAADEDDDYMNMTFTESSIPKIETSIQRRARKQRESELKSRAKSKAERAADEAAAREAALTTSLDSTNKGFRMMQKLGFKGGALGKAPEDAEVRTEPIHLVLKEDRGGIGLDSEKKRKFREEVEVEAKKVKVEEGDYRVRLMKERDIKRLEGQFWGAMSVAERMDEEEEAGMEEVVGATEETATESHNATKKQMARANSKPLHKVNILWRALVKQRIEKEREKRMRYDLHQSLSRLPTYDDPEEDEHDRRGLGKEEEDIEEEDPELDEFLALEPGERLEKLVGFLRMKYHYCFWCKYRYPDETIEGCPGTTEEDHD